MIQIFFKRLIPILFIFAACSLGARGMDDAAESGGGEGASNPASPQRIVQVGSSAFIILDALYMFPEASERVIAMADGNQGNGFFASDIDPRSEEKIINPRQVATEEILAQNPDLVVMKNFLKSPMGEPIERVGVKTLYLDLETPEAWKNDLAVIGDMFGNPDRAEELINLFDKRIAAVEEPLADLKDSEKPRTLMLYWSVKDGKSAVNVPPLSWIQTRMVEMAGGDPVWKDADLGERWTKTNIEQIAAWNPDVIMVAAYHVDAEAAVKAIEADPVWSSLDAVKNNRLYAFPADYHSWDQPDARWLMGLTWTAGVLHPKRFPDLDMENEARSFFQDFFFLDEEAYDEFIAPRLGSPD